LIVGREFDYSTAKEKTCSVELPQTPPFQRVLRTRVVQSPRLLHRTADGAVYFPIY
jgi:hypothetical protein